MYLNNTQRHPYERPNNNNNNNLFVAVTISILSFKEFQ